MPNFHLSYLISKQTPPHPKALRDILALQEVVNRRCSWSHERLALAPAREPARVPLVFPFVRLHPTRSVSDFSGALRESQVAPVETSCSGSTRVRDDLWNAHLVAAFLRTVSARHPELLLELRDEVGFVVPGSVWIRNGQVELHREWLNRERERVLEMTGDLQQAAPYLWAEAEALQGRVFMEASATDFAERPEVKELDTDWEQLTAMSTGELAELVVDHLANEVVVRAA